MNLSHRVIGCALEVHRTLGHGFLEAVYQRALAHELRLRDIPFETQVSYTLMYKGSVVGTYLADLIVAHKLVVELKSTQRLCPANDSQLINYLKASGLCVGLLLNFGARSLEIRRLANRHDDANPL